MLAPGAQGVVGSAVGIRVLRGTVLPHDLKWMEESLAYHCTVQGKQHGTHNQQSFGPQVAQREEKQHGGDAVSKKGCRRSR